MIDVAPTRADPIWRENKWQLLRYRPTAPRAAATPILLIPSLINRHYVLDLIAGHSLVEYLVGRGHPVYCVDWGTPGDEDRFLELDDFVAGYIGRAVRQTIADSSDPSTKGLHLLGYCLGGTLATAYAAAFPGQIATLTAMAAPIDFDHGGILTDWVRTETFDLEAFRAIGNLPWPLMQAAFHCLKPTLKISKLILALRRGHDPGFRRSFLALERWGTDNVSFPGTAYNRYIAALYRANELYRGDMVIAGQPADLASIACPLHIVAFEGDHIVPEASALALADKVSSTDVKLWCRPGGHVSTVISQKAADGLWRDLSDFWMSRDCLLERQPVAARVAS